MTNLYPSYDVEFNYSKQRTELYYDSIWGIHTMPKVHLSEQFRLIHTNLYVINGIYSRYIEGNYD